MYSAGGEIAGNKITARGDHNTLYNQSVIPRLIHGNYQQIIVKCEPRGPRHLAAVAELATQILFNMVTLVH